MVMLRILYMFKNLRGPITVNVLMYARGKIPGSCADIAGISIFHTSTFRAC